MAKHFRAWVLWFVFLIVIDFTVPFLLLKDVPKLTGSFLFWIVWVLAAIAGMFFIFLRWREGEP